MKPAAVRVHFPPAARVQFNHPRDRTVFESEISRELKSDRPVEAVENLVAYLNQLHWKVALAPGQPAGPVIAGDYPHDHEDDPAWMAAPGGAVGIVLFQIVVEGIARGLLVP